MKKILLIEDDYALRSIVKDLLEANNYKIFTASDGIEGIQLAKEILPDLIICDVMMPKLNGFEVINNLRKDSILSFIPFIFLTAKTELNDFREGMELGADDYITKPFRASGLLKVVEIRLAKYEALKQKNKILFEEETENKKESLTENDRLFINVKNKPQIIKVGDIVFIKADGEYSNIHLNNGLKILKRKSLKEWEQQLPCNIFLRIHRSTIINVNYLDKIEKWHNRTYIIFLKHTAEKFIISQRYSSKIRSNLMI
jgi:DNA-binding response OmpR family regulator